MPASPHLPNRPELAQIRHRVVAGLLAVAALLAATSAQPSASRAAKSRPVTYQLNVSTSNTRSNPSLLNGQSFPAGSGIYVFTSPNTSRITSVAYTADGTPVRTESKAPYDLGSSNDTNGTANPYTVQAGTHAIAARINFSDGSFTTVSGTYTGTSSELPPPPPPPDGDAARRIRSLNISAFDANDQFITSTALQAAIAGYRIPYLRIPFRSNFTDADYRKLLTAIKNAGAVPQVIVRGVCTRDVAASNRVLSLVDEVFPTGDYWVEFGNEHDLQCGASAAGYTTAWNQDVPSLKASHPRARFMGPVNFQYNGPYLLHFLQNASPRPDAVSWHEYVCGTMWSNDTCLNNVANWTNHLNNADAQFSTAGYRVPVWITEWNMNPEDEARYQQSFIQTWTQRALDQWSTLAGAGKIAVAMNYTMASHGTFNGQSSGFQLFAPGNSLTLQGQTFFAGL
jgi:Glycosyl hydrolase catalytic core